MLKIYRNIYIFLFLLLISQCTMEQYCDAQRYEPASERSGYSRTIGNKTYHFDARGRRIGYSQKVGDKTIEYGTNGRMMGYSKTDGSGITRYYSNNGAQLGHKVKTGPGYPGFETQVNEPGTDIDRGLYESHLDQKDTFDQKKNSSYWGFYDNLKQEDMEKITNKKE